MAKRVRKIRPRIKARIKKINARAKQQAEDKKAIVESEVRLLEYERIVQVAKEDGSFERVRGDMGEMFDRHDYEQGYCDGRKVYARPTYLDGFIDGFERKPAVFPKNH